MENNTEKVLAHVSASPHFRSQVRTKNLMYDVIIAMLPALAWGVFHFGFYSLVITLATVAACVIAEYAFEKGMKKPITIMDGSAVVTGMILALNMPPAIPVYIPVIGGVFAIIVVKQLFGGLGQNFMNPALAARCFLLISFAKKMTDFDINGMSGATPLAAMKAGESADLGALFFGNIQGTIGEVSTLALLIGAAYLLARKVITIRIPAVYIITTVIMMGLFGGRGFDPYYLACQICAGGLIFGAFFMATDYVTSPLTPMGQVIFGIVLGVLTGLFRAIGGSAEGVSYAIILGNIMCPLIERYTIPTAFGKGRYAELTKKLMQENKNQEGK